MVDKNQFPVWCIEHKKEVFINDVETEYGNYLKENKSDKDLLLEDGTVSKKPLSLIYLPLMIQDKVLGIITVQCFTKNAYTRWHQSLLGTLAVYVASALENANNYQKSESLLLNILPEETALELKERGFSEPKHFDQASVLFTDFKGFTTIAEKLTPQELVAELDTCFQAFDEICQKHNLEKIKTIGDAYMAVAGVPVPDPQHAGNAVKAGLDMLKFMEKWKTKNIAMGKLVWEIRVGIHSGPLVAGVVGKHKFAYDIWGDTVNTANRMESSGEAGKLNISDDTYRLIDSYQYRFEYRGEVAMKNKKKVGMWFVEENNQSAQSE